MKNLLRSLVRWILIGLVVITLTTIVVYQLIQAQKLIGSQIGWIEITIILALALIIGISLTRFYVSPIKFFAKLTLNFFSIFYEEFFKQGAKYFATGNRNKPFETVVQVSVSEKISMLGFVTNVTSDGNHIVFIPTSRRLTSGINIVASPSSIRKTDITMEQLLKFVVTSGAFPIDSIK